MFLEKLVEILVNAWGRIAPFVVVRAWEHAVVLRLGKYHRTRGPGLRFKWFFLEESYEVSTATTTMRLPPQSVTTKDEQSVVAGVVVRYRIIDPKPYICDLTDQADALIDVTAGAVLKHVRKVTSEELFNRPPETAIRAELRDHVKQYGFEIEAVTFKDLTRGKTLRLAGTEAKDLPN